MEQSFTHTDLHAHWLDSMKRHYPSLDISRMMYPPNMDTFTQTFTSETFSFAYGDAIYRDIYGLPAAITPPREYTFLVEDKEDATVSSYQYVSFLKEVTLFDEHTPSYAIRVEDASVFMREQAVDIFEVHLGDKGYTLTPAGVSDRIGLLYREANMIVDGGTIPPHDTTLLTLAEHVAPVHHERNQCTPELLYAHTTHKSEHPMYVSYMSQFVTPTHTMTKEYDDAMAIIVNDSVSLDLMKRELSDETHLYLYGQSPDGSPSELTRQEVLNARKAYRTHVLNQAEVVEVAGIDAPLLKMDTLIDLGDGRSAYERKYQKDVFIAEADKDRFEKGWKADTFVMQGEQLVKFGEYDFSTMMAKEHAESLAHASITSPDAAELIENEADIELLTGYAPPKRGGREPQYNRVIDTDALGMVDYSATYDTSIGESTTPTASEQELAVDAPVLDVAAAGFAAPPIDFKLLTPMDMGEVVLEEEVTKDAPVTDEPFAVPPQAPPPVQAPVMDDPFAVPPQAPPPVQAPVMDDPFANATATPPPPVQVPPMMPPPPVPPAATQAPQQAPQTGATSGDKPASKVLAGKGVEVYVERAFVGSDKSGKLDVMVQMRKRRDVDPDAPFAGSYIREAEMKRKDGSSYTMHLQKVTPEVFNHMREVNNLPPLSEDEFKAAAPVYNENGERVRTGKLIVGGKNQPNLVMRANVFTEDLRGKNNKFSHLINPKSIEPTAYPHLQFSIENEVRLYEAKKAERSVQQTRQNEQGGYER